MLDALQMFVYISLQLGTLGTSLQLTVTAHLVCLQPGKGEKEMWVGEQLPNTRKSVTVS